MKRIIIFLALAAAGGALYVKGGLNLPSLPDPRPTRIVQEVVTVGDEPPIGGAVYLNGFNVANVGEIRMLDFYRQYGGLQVLGEPVSALNAQGQAFRFAKISYSAVAPPTYALQADNLGLLALQLEGRTATPYSSPHPVLRDYLLRQAGQGADLERFYGRVVSPALCEKRICKQYLDKALVSWNEGALTADGARREPLGAYLEHPRLGDRTEIDDQALLPTPLVLGAGGLLGLVLLTRIGQGRTPRQRKI